MCVGRKGRGIFFTCQAEAVFLVIPVFIDFVAHNLFNQVLRIRAVH